MALDANSTFIPGRGTVFVAAPDTVFPDYKTIKPEDPTTYTGWECLGHTSRENTVELTVDGGEAETKGSWWSPNLRTTRTPRVFGGSVKSLQMDQTTLELAFPGGRVENGAFIVPSNAGDVEKAIFILSEDQTGDRMGIGIYRASLSLADAPTFDVENFFEVPLGWQTLDSTKHPGDAQAWFHPALNAAVSPGA
ncbi:hypothetical protein JRG19_02565 [Pseudoclavibacter alba]|uniref:phage tail tube protein n=1 Tax=Pseudoclavibacter albus TaxID=272241 RepID=UPI0019CFEE7A|nr:hypothetical protein [Pseudoclavibacter alba]MBN6777433.1 hypothetical protein [Pseudoclavibacter alba]